MSVAPAASSSPLSYLDLINICDNYRIPAIGGSGTPPETLTPWHLAPDPSSPVIGLLRPCIFEQLLLENAKTQSEESSKQQQVWHISGAPQRVSFASWVDTPAKRTRVMQDLCERWRDSGLWSDIIGPKKWRAEVYPVYRNPFGKQDAPAPGGAAVEDDGLNYAFEMERSACALFGVVTYGVHMTVYHDEDSELDGAGCRIWVPRRARTKPTWPGYLDNSVAGGIPSGYGIFESLVKEAMEEASLAEEVIRKHAKAAGCVSYFFRRSAGWLQPEIEYVYDLRVPSGVDPAPFVPKPLDGEVEAFELLPLVEVTKHMRAGLFKANCALVLIDFMIRRGYITPENEPAFLEIITRMHGDFDYPRWSAPQ